MNENKEKNDYSFIKPAMSVTIIAFALLCTILLIISQINTGTGNSASEEDEEKLSRFVSVECRFHNYEVVKPSGLVAFLYDNEKENVTDIVAVIAIYPDGRSKNLIAYLFKSGKYTAAFDAGNDKYTKVEFEVENADYDYILDIDCITGDLQLTRSDHPVESPDDEDVGDS